MARRVIKVEKKADERIAGVGCLAIEAFKTFDIFKDMKVTFGQMSFNAGWEVGFKECQCLVVAQLPTADLSFLDGDEEGTAPEPIPPEHGVMLGWPRGEQTIVEVFFIPNH